jgi:CheY-like chemotaxis protein
MAKILVVDDDPNTRLLLRTVLSYGGHDVIEAADGVEGLASAFRQVPDLILLDLSMPAMSGPEFLRALRAEVRGRSSKVALYTASAVSAAMRDFMEMYQIEHVIPKPSEPRELLEAIERALTAPPS